MQALEGGTTGDVEDEKGCDRTFVVGTSDCLE
jgi:hypothetical protein